MTNKFVWALALVPLFAFQSVPASACHVVGHKNGEPLCETTSDGNGQVYKKDDRPIFVPDTRPIFVPKLKAVQAMEIAKSKRHLAALKRRGHNLH